MISLLHRAAEGIFLAAVWAYENIHSVTWMAVFANYMHVWVSGLYLLIVSKPANSDLDSLPAGR